MNKVIQTKLYSRAVVAFSIAWWISVVVALTIVYGSVPYYKLGGRIIHDLAFLLLVVIQALAFSLLLTHIFKVSRRESMNNAILMFVSVLGGSAFFALVIVMILIEQSEG